ncbi:MAG: glycosyltransferase family 4 protein [Verrucomicrobiota bacterium]
MKILIVHNSLNDGTSMSGVLKHYLLMARAWSQRGNQVDFLVARAGYPQIQSMAPQCGWVCSDRYFDASRYLDQTWRYFPAFGFRLLSAHWRRLPCAYDVVYASNFLIFEVYPAWKLARRYGAKFVVKVQHLLHAQSNRHSLFDRLFLASEKWAFRLADRYADLVMCLSRPVEQDCLNLKKQLGLHRVHPRVVGCGLDFSELDSTPAAAHKYDVVILGRVHEQKGVFDIPEVWRRIVTAKPDARLVVIGEGPHRPRLMQLMREQGLGATVEFTGGVSEERKNTLLKQARVGLSLSFEEGWGLSVTEFLAAGLPVVAYELPVFQELFAGVLQMVPSRSCPEAADNVLRLLEDAGRRQSLGEIGRQHVNQYQYEKVADQEMDLMRELF